MTDTDQEREDEVLKRMLKTPHKPHKHKPHKEEGRAKSSARAIISGKSQSG